MYGLKLAPNFSWSEVACPCGCVIPEDVAREAVRLSRALQHLRDLYGPVKVTSWYRCPEHNASLKPVPGATNSQHLYGRAADIKCLGCPDLADWCDRFFPNGGVGTYARYPRMVHVDLRGVRARWRK